MSRTIIALVAVGAIVLAAALGVAWRVKMNDQDAIANAPKPRSAPIPAPQPPAAEPQATPAPALAPPIFDVARIGADGRAVIAGRAQPGAKVILPDGGKEIANGVADARGEWVMLAQEPPLSPGQHE